MNRTLFVLCATVMGLTACVGGPAPRPAIATYDLGNISPLQTNSFPIGRVDVNGPGWLDSPAMQYRQAADPARRQTYAESRWVAPPGQLVEAALRRQLIAGTDAGCRVRVELDEWIQQFDESGASRAQAAARVSLFSARGDELLGRKAMRLEQAAGADARGGVTAFTALQLQVAEGIAAWVQSSEIVSLRPRCRS